MRGSANVPLIFPNSRHSNRKKTKPVDSIQKTIAKGQTMVRVKTKAAAKGKSKEKGNKTKAAGADVGVEGQRAKEDCPADVSLSNGWGVVQSYRIRSWPQFAEILQQMPFQEWCFRGQDDSQWKLKTGLDRKRSVWEKKYDEDLDTDGNEGITSVTALNWTAAQQRHPFTLSHERVQIEEFKGQLALLGHFVGDNLSALGMMQHYGAKTRLLDFTFSPYVATYFAFEREESFTERAIYAINLENLSTKAKQLLTSEFDSPPGLDYPVPGLGSDWAGYEEIAKKHVGNNLETEKKVVIPVKVTTLNTRINSQAGLFLLPLTFAAFDETLASMLGKSVDDVNNPPFVEADCKDLAEMNKPVVLIRFVFDKTLNGKAIDFLQQANLSPRTIYPDLEGLAKSMDWI